MRFDYLSYNEYDELVTHLERPVRFCNIAHEDVQRSPEGSLLLPVVYNDECVTKHMGCPHLLNELLAYGNPPLERHLSTRGGMVGQRLFTQLNAVRVELFNIDHDIREARTGTSYPGGLAAEGYAPPSAEQQQKIVPLLEAEAKALMARVEELRLPTLELVLQTPPIFSIKNIRTIVWRILTSEESGLQWHHASQQPTPPLASH